VNKDNFRFYASDSHLLRSVWVAQYCFRNAKKRFMQKYKKEPELTFEPDLKEFTKIYSGKTSVKKQNEVLTIAANLNNPIESLEKKISFDNKSGEFRLADILQAENENIEQDCIQQKNREVLIKEIESILSPEQANLVKLYFRLSTTEELTKEEIANKLGWTRNSKLYGVVPNTSKVKNSLNKSKEILKQNPAFRALLMNSI
jgi:DNA-directed RNA polymerase sigma subunit (sigma70/sigma32)